MTATPVEPPAILDVGTVRGIIADKGDRLFSLLYASSQPRLGTYIALADAISEAGDLAVVVAPPNTVFESEELVGFESVRFANVTGQEMATLQGVDVFFSPEVVTDGFPPGSATVGIFHSIPDVGLRRDQLVSNAVAFVTVNPTIIRSFDYLIAAVRQKPEHWSPDNYQLIGGIYPREFLSERRSVLDVVPGGYPKLEYSKRVLRSDRPLDTILYSPTAGHARFGYMKRDGQAVIETLLGEFPDMRVILRPYPNPADLQAGRQLVQYFDGIPNLELDTSTTGIGVQQTSALVVTDRSSSAITFSLATGRPLVFADLAGDQSAVTPTENPFGYTVTTTAALIEAVHGCLDDSAGWAARIAEEAEKNLYNPGTAARYLAGCLADFARKASRPDWLSVERTPWGAGEDPAAVERHLERLRAWHERTPSPRSAVMVQEITDFLGGYS